MNLLEARTYHLSTMRLHGARAPTESFYQTHEDYFLHYLDSYGLAPELGALNHSFVEDCALWMQELNETRLYMFKLVLLRWSAFLTDRGVYPVDPLVTSDLQPLIDLSTHN